MLELQVIQLARLYISLCRVPNLSSKYLQEHEQAQPLFHSKNATAFPLDSCKLIRKLGISATDLGPYLTVLFEGDNRESVRRDSNLKASVPRLRAAFRWLLFDCWPWLEATQDVPVTSHFFGADLEAALQSYATDNPSTAGVVPEAIVQQATGAGNAPEIRPAAGPADAVASSSDESDDERAQPLEACDDAANAHATSKATSGLPFDAAI